MDLKKKLVMNGINFHLISALSASVVVFRITTHYVGILDEAVIFLDETINQNKTPR